MAEGFAEVGIEKRVIAASTVFVLSVIAVIGLSVKMFGIGVPTCLTDVRPFNEAKLIEQAPKRYELRYVARMWKFEPADVAIEPGSTVDLYLSTPDVTHGIQIPGTNVNLLAVPGAVNYARVKFDKEGEYLVVCNEYCGTQHHNMAGRIHVSAAAVAATKAAAAAATAAPKILEDNGCTACHSLDGTPGVGPSFKGLYGSQRTLASGKIVVADDHYLRESIIEPEEDVVKGFEPMPPVDVKLSDIQALIDAMKAVR